MTTVAQLLAAGITYSAIRRAVEAGRWTRLGRRTLGISVHEATGRARWHWALWETHASAVLDGPSALVAAGLGRWDEPVVHVCVADHARVHRLPGVAVHRPRRPPEVVRASPPRVAPTVAVIRAAQWARSERQAATVLAMAVQQRVVHGPHVMEEWRRTSRSPRRAFLSAVISDVCDGAQALGELDFAALCRRRGLPRPTRQVVRTSTRGRQYLDAAFEGYGVVVKIDGVQHGWGLVPVDDALRDNDGALTGEVRLRIPVLGLRVSPEAFMDQVERAPRSRGWRPSGRLVSHGRGGHGRGGPELTSRE